MTWLYAPATPPPSEGDGPLVVFLLIIGIALVMGAAEWNDRRRGVYPRDWENDE